MKEESDDKSKEPLPFAGAFCKNSLKALEIKNSAKGLINKWTKSIPNLNVSQVGRHRKHYFLKQKSEQH